ncbi:MAG: glycosyltransferase [Planctomycetota bacterium]
MSHSFRPLVSVLINNYNYADYLGTAIESALGQDYAPIEIIVVDDGSTDGSTRVLDHYADRIVAVTKPNGGQGSAFNAGFVASTGELICFLDADDTWAPDKVRRVVDAACAAPEAGLILHHTQRVDHEQQPLGSRQPRRLVDGDHAAFVGRWGGWPYPPTSGIACRRALLEQIFPMPEAEFRVSADRYVAVLGALVAPMISIDQSLAFCLVHDRNLYHSEQKYAEAERLVRHKQFLEDSGRAIAERAKRCAIDHRYRLDDNLQFQLLRCRCGEPVSLASLVRLTLISPGIHGWANRIKALARNLPRALARDLAQSTASLSNSHTEEVTA